MILDVYHFLFRGIINGEKVYTAVVLLMEAVNISSQMEIKDTIGFGWLNIIFTLLILCAGKSAYLYQRAAIEFYFSM